MPCTKLCGNGIIFALPASPRALLLPQTPVRMALLRYRSRLSHRTWLSTTPEDRPLGRKLGPCIGVHGIVQVLIFTQQSKQQPNLPDLQQTACHTQAHLICATSAVSSLSFLALRAFTFGRGFAAVSSAHAVKAAYRLTVFAEMAVSIASMKR